MEVIEADVFPLFGRILEGDVEVCIDGVFDSVRDPDCAFGLPVGLFESRQRGVASREAEVHFAGIGRRLHVVFSDFLFNGGEIPVERGKDDIDFRVLLFPFSNIVELLTCRSASMVTDSHSRGDVFMRSVRVSLQECVQSCRCRIAFAAIPSHIEP